MRRQTDGRETWYRLLDWDKGQAPSERLAAQILISEKYISVDPSHPLGGRDGLKDILCKKEGLKYVAASYFPRGQKSFSDITNKFKGDLAGIDKNNADGIAFITNQELRLGEREELVNLVPQGKEIDLFHLERLTAILNSPINYGTRLEFLDIEMTKEEQLAYMGSKDQIIHDLINLIMQTTSNTQIQVDPNATPVTVSSERFEYNNIFGLPYANPYHKCSYCGYGFKIARRGQGIYYMEPISVTPSYSATGKTTVELVTCPKCGNTDKV